MWLRAQNNVIGPLGKNCAYLKISPSAGPALAANRVSVASRISHIHELIRLRDGLDQLDVLSQEELDEMLVYLCTN